MIQLLALTGSVYFFASMAFADIKEEKGLTTVRFGVAAPTLEFSTNAQDPPGKKLNFKANAPSKVFLSFSHDWYGLTVSSINPVSSDKEQTLGVSKSIDYQLRFYFTRFAAEVFYQRYKGYYIDNTQDVIAGWDSSQPRRLYPDLTTEHRGLSLSYVFSPENYSLSAAFDQTRQQTKSGGSWLANFSLSQHLIHNPTPLIPTELAGTYGDFEKFTGGTLTSVTLGGGGGYTFVFLEDWFLAAQLIADFGEQFSNVEMTDGSSNQSRFGFQAHIKAGLGYNGDKFIAGANLLGDTCGYNIENTELSFVTLELGLFVGSRF